MACHVTSSSVLITKNQNSEKQNKMPLLLSSAAAAISAILSTVSQDKLGAATRVNAFMPYKIACSRS